MVCDDYGGNRPLSGYGSLQGWKDVKIKWDGVQAEQALNAQQAQQIGQNAQVQAAVASVEQQTQQQTAHLICIWSRHSRLSRHSRHSSGSRHVLRHSLHSKLDKEHSIGIIASTACTAGTDTEERTRPVPL